MSDSKQPLVLAIDLKPNAKLCATSFSWFNTEEMSLEQIDLIPVKTKEAADSLKHIVDNWDSYDGEDISRYAKYEDPLYLMAPPYIHINSYMIKPNSGELIIESDATDNIARQVLPFTFDIQHLGESIGAITGSFSLEGYLEKDKEFYKDTLDVVLTIDTVGLSPGYRSLGIGKIMASHLSDYFGKMLNNSMSGMDSSYVSQYRIIPTLESEAYSRSGYNLLSIMSDTWEHSVNVALREAVGLEAEEANFSVGL